MDKFDRLFKASMGEEVPKKEETKLEEAGLLGGAASLLSKFKALKPIQQAANIGKDVKGALGRAPGNFSLLNKLGASKAEAGKAVAGALGRGLKNTAKANPYGAGLIGGTGALAAWGLKRPKKVEEAVPFFMKKKGEDKGKGGPPFGKGKDEEKGGPPFGKGKDKEKKGGFPFGKGKGKGKAEEALENAKDKAKKKGGFPFGKGKGEDKGKGGPPAFLKGKGKDKGGPPMKGKEGC